MAEITLTLRANPPSQPVDLREVTPDNFAGKTIEQVASLPIWIGNRPSTLGVVFDVKGETSAAPQDQTIIIEGSLPNSRRIGAKMTAGKIIINGKAGIYVGGEMKNGQITVNGDAGEWAGLAMKGGSIEITGNAGDFLGAAYRGARSGMKGGIIVVKGNAGSEAAAWMSGGLIKIFGDAGILPGIHMTGGSILIGGNCPGRVGASMTGGKIAVVGKTDDLLAGFQIEEIKDKAKIENDKIPGPFYTFSGDNAEAGVGKLFIHKERNPHLAGYEAFL
ncbi:MAG: formylmethanofuran dehydrogenase subunit C [Thaumarchaeota archaeon]|nr:formylmethanofuran dehydrogenase subunit C [Nitrososphaerota archaeon]MCL5318699.1 formylmethanofuran dehydrogenase subunit C [Nitrososphaerota archaeon]